MTCEALSGMLSGLYLLHVTAAVGQREIPPRWMMTRNIEFRYQRHNHRMQTKI
jgi:hypothetical protein